MAWKRFNPNPIAGNRAGDCVVRAISAATDKSWYDVYWDLCELGAEMGDWGNRNHIWRKYLRDLGFRQDVIPDFCPDCYTVAEFCKDNPRGMFILATGAEGGTHVVAVVDGDYYDSWDSGKEVPIYLFRRA